MKNRKWVGIVLLVVGIVIAGMSLAADTVMNMVADAGGYPGFGRSQLVAVIVGAIVAVVGLFLTLKSGSP